MENRNSSQRGGDDVEDVRELSDASVSEDTVNTVSIWADMCAWRLCDSPDAVLEQSSDDLQASRI